ncbi:MAG: ATP-binding protein [Luteolibacter sp.]
MTPEDLTTYLGALVAHELKLSAMIWGPPGIGKSSIVAQITAARGLDFIDLRLSQLAPTDLRGLPVASDNVSRWLPPDFLPRDGRGVLFLDELNLAPPTMQGMAQQLILDRRVGSYVVPEGWFIWAAGNRKEDRASVFDMPAPLANRFLHLDVEPHWESFKSHAIAAGVHEQIIAFLAFRPDLLHKLDAQRPAWPSPRSWEMAGRLHTAGLDIAPVVGLAVASEFLSYIELYRSLPELEPILAGEEKAESIPFPAEPSARYAATIGLTVRARNAERGYRGFKWLTAKAPPEWIQLFAVDLFKQMRALGKMGELAGYVAKDEQLRQFLADYQKLLATA